MMFEAPPMALTALLITAAQRVQRCTDDPLQQSIFVDDRAAAVTTAEDAKMMWGTWYADWAGHRHDLSFQTQ